MDTTTNARRRGQPLRGDDTTWTRLRIERDMSLTDLSAVSGIPRSVVGLICQGRMVPSPEQAAALLTALGRTA